MAAFGGLVFDGFELGLMPQASLPVTLSMMGEEFARVNGGKWFAWYTAALMLGAAFGGITLGHLGDRWGRSRAMSLSILIYSGFAGLGAWAATQEQMLVLRFLVGMGTGGMLPTMSNWTLIEPTVLTATVSRQNHAPQPICFKLVIHFILRAARTDLLRIYSGEMNDESKASPPCD